MTGSAAPPPAKLGGGIRLVNGTAFLTATIEWPKVRAVLDAGELAPLGLVKPHSLDFRIMGQHHQVLAYRYEIHGDDVAIDIYEPNYPGDDTARLCFNIANPDGENLITHSCEGPCIRGLFLTDYTTCDPNEHL